MSFEIDGLEDMIQALNNTSFQEELELWLEASGIEFLDIIQQEIINVGSVDTRALLNSFQRGGSGNVWSLSKGGLTLEIGTGLDYASYVNDGHYTTRKGVSHRWVPGRWVGNRFEYDPGNRETGMLLKSKWVEGSQYWDRALAIFEKIFERSLDKNLQHWLNNLI